MDEKELFSYLDDIFFGLKERLYKGTALTPEEEEEAEAWFLREYVLRPVEWAAAEGRSLPISVFQKVQKIIQGIFPYWIDNDRIYRMGRKKLAMLSLVGRSFSNQEELDRYFEKELIRPENEKPFVSIVMPTCNRAEKIKKSIDSILRQTYPKFELVVSDDGSTDETEAVVKSIQDDRVRYICSEENCGTSHAKNQGIREAKYDLIAFHDDDDLWRPEKLARQVYALTENPDAGFCYCEMIYHRLDGETIHYVPRREISPVRKNGYLYPELLRRNFVGGPTLLIRKECLDTVGYFDENLTVFEDWDLVLRLSARYEAVFTDEPLYDYYEHEKSLTTDQSTTHRSRVESSVRLFEEHYADERRAFGYTEPIA